MDETKKLKIEKPDLVKLGTQLVTSTVAAKVVSAIFLPPGTKFLGVALVNIGSSFFGDAVSDVVTGVRAKRLEKEANETIVTEE